MHACFVDQTAMAEIDLSTSMNKSCATTASMKKNLAYGTRGEMETSTHLPTPQHVHQQQDMELTANQAYVVTPNIPVEPNQCYVITTPSVDPDQLYATMEGDQQLELTENQAYTATPNIPVEPNQCYVTTTPSVDPDPLYGLGHAPTEEYDYIIP